MGWQGLSLHSFSFRWSSSYRKNIIWKTKTSKFSFILFPVEIFLGNNRIAEGGMITPLMNSFSYIDPVLIKSKMVYGWLYDLIWFCAIFPVSSHTFTNQNTIADSIYTIRKHIHYIYEIHLIISRTHDRNRVFQITLANNISASERTYVHTELSTNPYIRYCSRSTISITTSTTNVICMNIVLIRLLGN